MAKPEPFTGTLVAQLGDPVTNEVVAVAELGTVRFNAIDDRNANLTFLDGRGTSRVGYTKNYGAGYDILFPRNNTEL